uniref:Uncharacterized protein n=1 Tax=Arundo donax TaxID=35708 RepID=A0A0A8Y204_ARUDO
MNSEVLHFLVVALLFSCSSTSRGKVMDSDLFCTQHPFKMFIY